MLYRATVPFRSSHNELMNPLYKIMKWTFLKKYFNQNEKETIESDSFKLKDTYFRVNKLKIVINFK